MECWPLSESKSRLYSSLMMIAILMVQRTQGGCIEEERKALLEIKSSIINSYDSKADNLLPTWVDNGSIIGGGSDECCDWERVKCNTTTGHVTELSLDNLKGKPEDVVMYMDTCYRFYKTWPLNVSLFLHFEELRSLNLSMNSLDSGIVNTGLERLSSLKKLETLDLSWNLDIENDILPSLTTLTSLRTLDLSYTSLNGYFPTNEFAALENLEMLDLTYCDFNGTFQMQGFERVSILRKLKTLNLGSNRFNESIITTLSIIPSLKTLDLSGILLSGSFPTQELAHLTNLEKLDLSGNSLKKLDLSGYSLNGTSSIQDCKRLSRLKKLESIALAHNSFNKSIISCLSVLPSLKILDLSSNPSLGSSFPIQELSSLRELKTLDLSNCGLESLTLNDLPNLLDLEVLLLSDNHFNGTLPMEALASFHHLEVLDLSYNNFVGSIPLAIQALSSLRVVSFASNELNGSLPDHGLCELKNLHELDLSHNMFDGNLPQCFNSLSSLKLFDISSNRFTGMLLPSLIANLTSLEYVDFSHNKFEGSFSFSSFSNLTKLEIVQFICDNDKFEVETEEPKGWIPMFQLKVLVLPNCNMNRPNGSVLPGFLLHQHKLRVLNMSHNSLEG